MKDFNLNEETICNYKVSEKMKKVWKVELELLEELKRVCEELNITYFADSGTLIGAVRHEGFIPWDDDIDIVMKRQDYDILCENSDKFKQPFFLQNIYTDKGYFRCHSQLRNSNTTGILEFEINKNYKFNQGIFIDIFPLDEIPDDDKLFKKQIRKMKFINKIILNYYKNINEEEKLSLIKIIKILVVKGISIFVPIEKMYKYYEKISSQYNNKGNHRISYISYSLGKKKHIWKKESFESAKKVPFENTTINIPIGYDDRLRTEYGDYMVVKQAETQHGGLILLPDISYKKYLERKEVM